MCIRHVYILTVSHGMQQKVDNSFDFCVKSFAAFQQKWEMDFKHTSHVNSDWREKNCAVLVTVINTKENHNCTQARTCTHAHGVPTYYDTHLLLQ
jgi:hypothetical protein